MMSRPSKWWFITALLIACSALLIWIAVKDDAGDRMENSAKSVSAISNVDASSSNFQSGERKGPPELEGNAASKPLSPHRLLRIYEPMDFSSAKAKIDSAYFQNSPQELIKKADGGDAKAALLASEIIESCWALGKKSTMSYCNEDDKILVQRRVAYLLNAMQIDRSLNASALGSAAQVLAKYGAKEKEDRDLVNASLDLLHVLGKEGNRSAILALGNTYYFGQFSQRHPGYALAMFSMLIGTPEDTQIVSLVNSMNNSVRPGDRAASEGYIQQFISGVLPPLYLIQ